MISRVHKQGRGDLSSRFLVNMNPRRKLFIILFLFAQVGFIWSLSTGIRSGGVESFSNKVEIRRRRDASTNLKSPDEREDEKLCVNFTMEKQQFMKSYVKEVRNGIYISWDFADLL